MITAGFKGLGQAGEDCAPVMMHGRGLAMHEPTGSHDSTAEYGHQRLMAEAYTENRNMSRKGLDHMHRNAGVVRSARPGRDREMCGFEVLRFPDADGIVAIHAHVGTEDQERLHQVIGEGIVVIDEKESWHHKPSFANSSARRSAAPLASTSAYSAAGTLSATIPAPAW